MQSIMRKLLNIRSIMRKFALLHQSAEPNQGNEADIRKSEEFLNRPITPSRMFTSVCLSRGPTKRRPEVG